MSKSAMKLQMCEQSSCDELKMHVQMLPLLVHGQILVHSYIVILTREWLNKQAERSAGRRVVYHRRPEMAEKRPWRSM